MDQFLTYTLLGLVLGSVYAIAASGLVLTYTTSGVFNFAHGAQAMLAAFLYWQFTVGWGIPVPIAFLLIVLVVGPLTGLVLHRLVMHGLRDVAEVTKVVVTVAVLLGLVGLSQWIWNPAEPRTLDMLWGARSSFEVLGVSVRYHELLCLGAAAALALGLRLLFTRSTMGLTMRAVVDDPDLLRLNGFNPDRIAATSWALGAALAALAGVLVTPVAGGSLEANMLTLLVIDTFAAAMFGRLKSIPRTFVGALVLGLSMTYVLGYSPSEWTWVGNLKTALPMIVLFLVLLVLPQERLRGAQMRTRERARVPSVRAAAVWAGVFLAIMFVISQIVNPIMLGPWAVGITSAIVALSLVPLTGYAGEINLAPFSFGSIAVIVAFHVGVNETGLDARLDWQGVVAGTVAAAVVGGLVALPALRLRGLYLGLATMAFGGLVSAMVLSEVVPRDWPIWGTHTIFPAAVIVIPPLDLGPIDLGDDGAFLMAVSAVFALLAIAVVALRNSGYGRRLAAMKDSPAASAMLGQSLVRLKLSVFMLSAAIAGLGSILMTTARGSVAPDNFLITVSLSLVMLTVVGGVSFVSGALFAGLMVGVVPSLIGGNMGRLADEHTNLAPLLETVPHLFVIGIALMGIGVNHSPAGIVAQICEGFRPLRNVPQVVAVGVGASALLVALAWGGVIGNGWMAVGVICVLMLMPVLARIWMPERFLTPEQLAEHEAARRTPPVEMMGLDRPLSAEERYDLDEFLGVPPRPLPAADVVQEAVRV